MSKIEFSKPERELITRKLQTYFSDELSHDLGGFEAEFLLDFLTTEIGTFFYNRGLYDARAVLSRKFDELDESILGLEQ